MKIVLLSGGSGKRLWPLSNEIRSKQFLKVVCNEKGGMESMLQRVYRQLSDAGLGKDITIATGETQVESIRNQLNDQVSIVVEPERRNTFPAILLAAAYLYFEKKCDPSETVVILPVDPYVDQAYFQLLKELDKAAQAGLSDIVLMGVQPTYPSEKYGYIIPEDRETPVSRVLEFREKPDAQTAQGFIDKGGLWNCGVFALKLSYLMEFVKRAGSSYEEVAGGYSGFERTSFDYAVVEKAGSVSVIRYEGEWKDLGTWNTLTEVMDETPIGDVQIADNCINTHVINELELPMVVAVNMVDELNARGDKLDCHRLEQALGVSGNELRRQVNRLRRRKVPICSGGEGYFYARNAGEIYATISGLKDMMYGLGQAIDGLEAALESFGVEQDEAGPDR